MNNNVLGLLGLHVLWWTELLRPNLTARIQGLSWLTFRGMAPQLSFTSLNSFLSGFCWITFSPVFIPPSDYLLRELCHSSGLDNHLYRETNAWKLLSCAPDPYFHPPSYIKCPTIILKHVKSKPTASQPPSSSTTHSKPLLYPLKTQPNSWCLTHSPSLGLIHNSFPPKLMDFTTEVSLKPGLSVSLLPLP